MAKGNARGIFKLKEAYEEQLSTPTNWTTLDDAWIANDSHIVTDFNFGYYCQGSGNTRVDRLDYSADTEMLVRCYTSFSNYQDSAFSSPSAGYIMGAGPGSGMNQLWQKINYSDDTSILTPGGTIGTPNPGGYTGGFTPVQLSVGNAHYAYQTEGRYLYKFDYSNDFATWVPAGAPQTPQPAPPTGAGGVGNQTHAYFTTGPNPLSAMVRMTYASDTSALAPKGPLAVPDRAWNFQSGNLSYGYWAGGGPGFTSPTTNVQRIDYANDTATASQRGNLNTQGCAGGSSGNPEAMWIAKYFNSPYVQKINYSQDTIVAPTKFNHTNTWWATGFGARNYGADGPTNLRAKGNVVPFGYNTGYTGGGYDAQPAIVSSVYRMDYDNDTRAALTKGPLSAARYSSGGSGSSFAAYFSGGYNGGAVATVDKVDYANDTGTAAPKGNLSHTRYLASAVGTQSKSYVMGGGPGPYSTIDRIDYATDTATAVQCASLPENRTEGQAVANADYGYFCGGYINPTAYSTVYRMDFSSDSGTPSPKGNLNMTIHDGAGTGNINYGYIMGGRGTPSSTKNNISRINYSNDTLETLQRGFITNPGNPGTVYQNGATGNQNYGYVVAGAHPMVSYTQRLDYSNDGVDTVTKGNMPVPLRTMGTASSRQNAFPKKGESTITVNYRTGSPGTHNYGYAQKPASTHTYRLDMSSDTCIQLDKTKFTIHRYQAGGASAGNNNYGYFGGGSPSNENGTSNIERLDYSNEALDLITRGFFTFQRYNLGSIHNTSYGYFCGGKGWPGSAEVSTIERLDYSNDQSLTTVKGALSGGTIIRPIMIGNQSYGYAVGGLPASNGGTQSQRIDYSNDTPVTSPKGKLTQQRYNGWGTSNSNYGWCSGGGQSSPAQSAGGGKYTSVERMDFASDTTNLVARGPVDDIGEAQMTTGNSIVGYLWGGGNQRYMQKIEYANDTARAMSVTPAMPTIGYGPYATNAYNMVGDLGIDARSSGALQGFEVPNVSGPQIGYPRASYVYWNGGVISPSSGTGIGDNYGGRYGTKYCIDNDTSTIVGTRSIYYLTGSIQRPGATGNTNYSWWCGGAYPYSSVIDRLDYSNDNAASIPKSTVSFSPVRAGPAATGNANYGYFMAGRSGQVVYSDIERLDYSNDTAAAASKGSLPVPRGGGSGLGNQSYGYYAGGWNVTSAYYSNVYRIDYSNDTPAATEKGKLPLARYNSASVSNNTDGYVYGGRPDTTVTPADFGGTTVLRINFANDTAAATPKSAMPTKFYGGSGSGNGTYGLISDNENSPYQSAVYRMDFSNDMLGTSPKGYRAAPFQTNDGGKSDAVCSGENGLQANTFTPSPGSATAYSWFAGGYSPSLGGNTMQRYDLSNDTANTSSNSLSSTPAFDGNPNSAAAGNSNYGYWAGGQPSTDSWRHCERVDYSNGFVGITAGMGILVVAMYYRGAATGNANYGYWTGGWNLSGPHAPSWPSTLVSRLDYSNDTTDMTNRADMNLGRSYFSATGNQSYGYWAMGDNSGGTKVERLDYSSDTSLTTVGDLVDGGNYTTTVGNGSYGYWCYSSNTKLQRVDYSNDTATGTEKGPLTIGHPGGQGSGNNTYGYITGGHPSSNTGWSVIDRLTYANDTTTTSPRGNLDINLGGYCGDGVGAADYALPQ